MALLKTQKNELLRVLVAGGFNPEHFQWDFARDDRLNYVGPGADGDDFYFAIDPAGHRVSDSPGWLTKNHDTAYANGFNKGGLTCFESWLRNLRRETAAPDLWADARALGTTLAKVEEPRQADPSTDDVPVVGEERARLLEAVEAVRRLVEAKTETDAEQKAQMLKTLDDVKEVSSAVTRKWLTQSVLGAVIGVVIKGALTQENALWLLVRLGEAFNAVHLFGEATVRALGP